MGLPRCCPRVGVKNLNVFNLVIDFLFAALDFFLPKESNLNCFSTCKTGSIKKENLVTFSK